MANIAQLKCTHARWFNYTQLTSHGNVSLVALLSLIIPCFSSHIQAIIFPKKKTQKPSTRSTSSSHNRQPQPPRTPPPPFLNPHFKNIRRHLFSLVRLPPRRRRLVALRLPRMFHEKRRRLGESASLSLRKAHLLQLHHRGILLLWWALAQPPPHYLPWRPLHPTNPLLLWNPKGRNGEVDIFFWLKYVWVLR